jgi:transcriptional regulator with XRE-family HTH domain
MAKRDPDPEPLDEELVEPEPSPVGEQLRRAREAKKLSLEDVAAQTRIPLRHLASIETGDWDNLPAPTYTIGFAKSYASAVGLDRSEVGNQLREEMGGQRFATNASDVFEPADPRRTMPKGLVIGAIVAVILLIAIMSWLNKRSLEEPEANNATAAPTTASAPAPPQVTAPPAPPAAAQGPVVLAATAPVWLQVSDRGASLFSGTLQPGQTYTVPASAAAPVLKTGKPEALKISVGAAVAPPVGPPATTVSDVSLLPADLMKSGPAAASQPASAPPIAGRAPPPKRAPIRRAAPSDQAALSAPSEPSPTTNSGE